MVYVYLYLSLLTEFFKFSVRFGIWAGLYTSVPPRWYVPQMFPGPPGGPWVPKAKKRPKNLQKIQKKKKTKIGQKISKKSPKNVPTISQQILKNDPKISKWIKIWSRISSDTKKKTQLRSAPYSEPRLAARPCRPTAPTARPSTDIPNGPPWRGPVVMTQLRG